MCAKKDDDIVPLRSDLKVSYTNETNLKAGAEGAKYNVADLEKEMVELKYRIEKGKKQEEEL